MSLDARRKQKQAAASTKNTKKKGNKISGPMRSISIGRTYREFEAPMDEDDRPVYRSVFDPKGTAATKIGKDVNKERVVNNSDFFKHINATVFAKVFGVPLRGKVARMLIEGISDQCLVLSEGGYRIKLPNLVVMERVERQARKARNPRTGEEVSVPARTALSSKPTRSAKHYMAQSN
jgi:DNA-binding protein HU-beta